MPTISEHIKPPGPKGLQLWRAFRKMQKNPIATFSEDIQLYGPIVHYAFPLRPFTVISEPDHIYHVLNANAENYNKDTYSYRQLRDFVGEGLFTANGSQWKKYRLVLQKALVPTKTTKLEPAINNAIKKWEEKRILDAHAVIDTELEMTCLAMLVVCRCLLGYPLEDRLQQVAQAVATITKFTNKKISYPLHPNHWLPTTEKKDYDNALNILEELVQDILVQFKNGELGKSPLLDQLDNKDEHYPDEEIRDQIMTLFLAGHETTAQVLSWFLFLVAQHPGSQKEIRTSNTTSVKGHSLTASAIMETMRLYPPIWLAERKALNGDTIGDYHIPAGSTIAIFCYHAHRNPKLWEAPNSFRPQRFMGQHQQKNVPRYAYFPFGGGKRHCIGSHFAMLELQLAANYLLQNYSLALADPTPVEAVTLLTLKASRPIKLKMEQL